MKFEFRFIALASQSSFLNGWCWAVAIRASLSLSLSFGLKHLQFVLALICFGCFLAYRKRPGYFNRNVHRWNNHLGHWIWIKLDINGIANCINLNGLLYCAHSLAHLPNANKNHQLLNSQSDTNPMPIHNKYSIFNKQTNSCAQIFHTHENTQHTYTEMLMHSSTLGWFVCLHFHMFVGAVAVLFSLHMHFGILDWCVWKRWQSERKEANNLPIETLIDTFIRYLLWVFDGISPLAVAIHDFFSLCDLFTTFNRIQYSTLMYFTRAFWPFHTVIVDG